MSKYFKQLTMVLLAIFTVTLVGCGGSDTTTVLEEAPLWCKAPDTLSDDGLSCVENPCVYPQVAAAGGCAYDTNQWVDGANDYTMPAPEYTPQSGEVVIYYALREGDYSTWGLHAWNNDVCNSYADFDRANGGTDWTAPITPTGIDPNFGAYWVMDLAEDPNCIWFIPHSLELGLQTADLSVVVSNAEANPTGAFFVLEGYEHTVFPWPRTFDSLVVPGGATPQCGEGEILNEAGDACIPDPSIEIPDVFVPGETVLYLRGGLNGWEAQDGYAFSYADNIYTMVARIEGSADPVEFKIADANWMESTSFGAEAGSEDIVLGEGKALTVVEGQNLKMNVAETANYQFTFDATDPAAPVLTVIEVAYDKLMYVKGTMNEWSNTKHMVYLGNHQYESEYALAAGDYEFKIADANWTQETNFGAAEGNEMLNLDEAKTLVFGEGVAMNIKMTIAEEGNYKFVLDATDLEAPILTVSNAIPYGDKTLYLKGSMNGWGTVEGYEFSYANNHYSWIGVMSAGDYEFKIADPDWLPTSTLGAMTDDQDVTLDSVKTLTLPGDNLKLSLAGDTLVMFDVDASDKAAPKLTVSKHVPYFGRTMYLKGSMNGWSNDDNYVLSVSDTGVFTLDVTLEAGTFEFKIADADWQNDSTLGAVAGSENVVLGGQTPMSLPGDGNFKLEITNAGEYSFSVNAATPSAPVLTVVAK